ncbi:MAG: GNAT family N-acetyltransferase [Terracidiphilus sp.]
MPFVIKPKMGKLAGLFGGIVAGSYSGKELAGSFRAANRDWPQTRSATLRAMLLRAALVSDIPGILALEGDPSARAFVGQWSEERHRATLAGGDARYLVSETESGDLQAYVILRGLSEESGSIELKRIVVNTPGQGLGRRLLGETIRIVFEELKAHRLFLDVYEDNARARHLYESLGFVYEGVMRDAARRDGRYHALHLMSMLESDDRPMGQSGGL